MKRDELRGICVLVQEGLCVVCGHGMYGDAEVHEAIVKRGDLPKDNRIFVPENCVAIHASCHKNTKEVDDACIKFLIGYYGLLAIRRFINGLRFKSLPGRAAEIMELEYNLDSCEYSKRR